MQYTSSYFSLMFSAIYLNVNENDSFLFKPPFFILSLERNCNILCLILCDLGSRYFIRFGFLNCLPTSSRFVLLRQKAKRGFSVTEKLERNKKI